MQIAGVLFLVSPPSVWAPGAVGSKPFLSTHAARGSDKLLIRRGHLRSETLQTGFSSGGIQVVSTIRVLKSSAKDGHSCAPALWAWHERSPVFSVPPPGCFRAGLGSGK